MNRILWALQILLAVVFSVFGGMKLSLPYDELVRNLPWAVEAPRWLPRLIGSFEVMGAVGLVAPRTTGIAPALTWLAAALLATVMLLAIGVHVLRGELAMSLLPAVLGLCCLLVARGRRVSSIGCRPKPE